MDKFPAVTMMLSDLHGRNSLQAIHLCYCHLRLNSTIATIGAPTSAVTEFIGSAPSKPGIRAMMQHARASAAPVSMVAGIITRWSLVRHIARHRCGTASPRNITGPQ